MHVQPALVGASPDLTFERLYAQYVRDVYRYALAVLRNPADAEDVTQTTFLNAYRAIKKGETPIKPQHWLIKIAHNACRTRYVRASRRPQEVPLDEGLRELAVPEEDVPDVQELLEALARLPFNQRSALVMRELEGRSYAEISELLGVSVAAVETLIFRARRTLRYRRASIQTALAAVPLPSSLSTFSVSGGGAAAAGGTLLGSGLIAKAVVVVATGLAVGGIGYKSVQATIFAPGRDVVAPKKPVLTVDSASRGPAGRTSVRRGDAAPAGLSPVRARENRMGVPEDDGATTAGGATGTIARPAAEASPAGGGSDPAKQAVSTTTTALGSVVQKTTDVVKGISVPTVTVPAIPPVPPVPPVATTTVLPPPPALPPPPPLPPPPTLP